MPTNKCKHWPGEERCFHEITVSGAEWRGLLKSSYELDLNDGSYYDGRSGAINFWCGPKDKPSDWPGRISRGALKYAREYVGAVFADSLGSGKVRLHFEICAYERAELKNLERGSTKWNKAIRGTKADRQWVLRQFKLLRQHARLMRRTSA